jgi:hypothetical protein
MTLQEWQRASGANVGQFNTLDGVAKYTPACLIVTAPEHYRALFGLSDYLVSSVAAGTVWLIPRKAGA